MRRSAATAALVAAFACTPKPTEHPDELQPRTNETRAENTVTTAPDTHWPSADDPPGAIRIKEETNLGLGQWKLGVMYIAPVTRPGSEPAMEIALALFNTETEEERDAILRAGDLLELGNDHYRVVRVVDNIDGQAAFAVIAPAVD